MFTQGDTNVQLQLPVERIRLEQEIPFSATYQRSPGGTEDRKDVFPPDLCRYGPGKLQHLDEKLNIHHAPRPQLDIDDGISPSPGAGFHFLPHIDGRRYPSVRKRRCEDELPDIIYHGPAQHSIPGDPAEPRQRLPFPE